MSLFSVCVQILAAEADMAYNNLPNSKSNTKECNICGNGEKKHCFHVGAFFHHGRHETDLCF